MSDRKYRQRGYQDDDRDRQPKPESARPAPEPGAPAATRRISRDGHRPVSMPGFREVVRCAQCGAVIETEVGLESRCPRCGVELHSCSQCTYFDPGSRFECMQQLSARISPKNTKNACTLYVTRTTVERETTTPRVDDARKAFDDLFKI
jgi:phage FluMu protein Com